MGLAKGHEELSEAEIFAMRVVAMEGMLGCFAQAAGGVNSWTHMNEIVGRCCELVAEALSVSSSPLDLGEPNLTRLRWIAEKLREAMKRTDEELPVSVQ